MKIYLVGGAVRDKLLGLPIKERDWVVVGATVADMLNNGFRQVGKDFPVFLHPKTHEEYALARMERKVRPGYQGFTFDTSSQVTLEEDLIRRDLTVNAMAYDVDNETLIDPYEGKKDLEAKLLRHVSPAFAEDPVRILRIGRFLARFASLGFHIAPETISLMQQMVKQGEVNALVAERVWKEWERALAEPNPEQFFMALNDCGALAILFPQLAINNPGIKALTAATDITHDPLVRFAVLLHALPHGKQDINALCQHFRAPNTYRELALLTAQYANDAINARTANADQLLRLLSALDIFRREQRFHDFLTASQIIAPLQNQSFDPSWLQACANAALAYNVRELVSEGLEGAALASVLKEKRRECIAAWLQTNP